MQTVLRTTPEGEQTKALIFKVTGGLLLLLLLLLAGSCYCGGDEGWTHPSPYPISVYVCAGGGLGLGPDLRVSMHPELHPGFCPPHHPSACRRLSGVGLWELLDPVLIHRLDQTNFEVSRLVSRAGPDKEPAQEEK